MRIEGSANKTIPDIDRWSTDNVTYTAVARDGGRAYAVSSVANDDGERYRTRAYSESLVQILSQLSINAEKSIESGDRAEYRLTTAEPRSLASIQNVSFSGVVTRDGVLTSYVLQYTVDRNGTTTDVIVRYSVMMDTDSPRPPSWLSEARNATKAEE